MSTWYVATFIFLGQWSLPFKLRLKLRWKTAAKWLFQVDSTRRLMISSSTIFVHLNFYRDCPTISWLRVLFRTISRWQARYKNYIRYQSRTIAFTRSDRAIKETQPERTKRKLIYCCVSPSAIISTSGVDACRTEWFQAYYLKCPRKRPRIDTIGIQRMAF